MKYVDYACAWTLFVFGVGGIMITEIRHPPHAVLDTPLLWILVAMFNLLRLRNGYSVANLKVFCIGANLATLILETVRLGMFGFFGFGSALALFILAETAFSLRETMTAKARILAIDDANYWSNTCQNTILKG